MNKLKKLVAKDASHTKYESLPMYEDVPMQNMPRVLTTLQIGGMTCSACTSSVESCLSKISGVSSVSVSLMTNQAIVEHDSSVSAATLAAAVYDLGFDASVASSVPSGVAANSGSSESPVSDQLCKSKISVHGMTCSACTQSVTEALQSVPGTKNVQVSLLTEEAVVDHTNAVSGEELAAKIDDCGFEAALVSSTRATSQQSSSSSALVETKLSVHGMTCSACVNSVTGALKSLPEVESVNVSLLTEEAVVFHVPSVSPEALKTAVDDCGFDAEVVSSGTADAGSLQRMCFKYYGDLDATEDELRLMVIDEFPAGIEVFEVNTDDNLITVGFKNHIVGVRDLYQYIQNTFEIDLLVTNSSQETNDSQLSYLSKFKEIQFWRNAFLKSLICGIPVFFLGHMIFHKLVHKFDTMLVPGIYLKDIVQLVLCTYLQVTVGKHFYVSAYKSLLHGSATMDVLVVTSTTISYFFSLYSMFMSFCLQNTEYPILLFDTASMLFIFISLGKWLESKAKAQTTSSLSELMKLIPYSCEVVQNVEKFEELVAAATFSDSEVPIEKISVDLLQLGDVVLIKPGDKVPTDGVLVYGNTEIDESLLTGESLPVSKQKGSVLIGGSVNLANSVYMRVVKVGNETQLSKIITLVKNAQFSKAPIQKYSDYIASKFVPAIIALAFFTFVFWYSVVTFGIMTDESTFLPKIFIKNKANGVFFNCLKIAISVVVIACPCALGLAAPTAIMVGTGVGAKNGILIKGGDVFQTLSQVNAVLFDKTNTLTTGVMSISEIDLREETLQVLGLTQGQFWYMVQSTEQNNNHPISRAIVRYLDNVKTEEIKTLNVENVVSKGVIGQFETDSGAKFEIKIGNHQLVGEKLIEKENSDVVPKDVGTVVFASINGKYCGRFVINDKLKPDARRVVEYLKFKGIEPMMVTGDNFLISKKIGKLLGIPLANIFAEVSPEEKEDIVANTKQMGKVLFIGDGINDAAAISSADIGVSFNDSTDIAASAADIILLDSDLKNLVMAIDISEKTFKCIQVNFLLASVYNLLMIPFAMAGIVSPFLAAASMSMSSVCVVTSSLRLKLWKPPAV